MVSPPARWAEPAARSDVGGICVTGRGRGRGLLRHRPGLPPRAHDLLERASLAQGHDAVDLQAGGALERAHAQPGLRAELAVGRRGVAELGQVLLQQPHVATPGADGEPADSEPAKVAGSAVLRAVQHADEARGHATRACEAYLGAEGAHHLRGVRPELPVGLDDVAEMGEHALQVPHCRAGGSRPQTAKRRADRRACGGSAGNQRATGKYRQQKHQQWPSRTVGEAVGSQQGFRRQGVSRTRRGTWRGGAGCAPLPVWVSSDTTGAFLTCREAPRGPWLRGGPEPAGISLRLLRGENARNAGAHDDRVLEMRRKRAIRRAHRPPVSGISRRRRCRPRQPARS